MWGARITTTNAFLLIAIGILLAVRCGVPFATVFVVILLFLRQTIDVLLVCLLDSFANHFELLELLIEGLFSLNGGLQRFLGVFEGMPQEAEDLECVGGDRNGGSQAFQRLNQ